MQMSVQRPEGREMRGTEDFRDAKSEARNINEQIRYVCRGRRGEWGMGAGGQVEVGMRTGVPLKNVINIVQFGQIKSKYSPHVRRVIMKKTQISCAMTN